MTCISNAWLHSHREQLIVRGKVLVAMAFARQLLGGFLLLVCIFLLIKEWRA